MTTEEALRVAILTHPGEDTPRLACADWLDESAGFHPCPNCSGEGCSVYGIAANGPCRDVSDGRRERAEFIRLQVRQCRAGAGRDAREDELLKDDAVSRQWFRLFGADHGLSTHVRTPRHEDQNFPLELVAERGFVRSVRAPVDLFLKHADAVLWAPGDTRMAPKCDFCGGLAEDERGRWKDKHGHDYWIRCGKCKGRATEPRPCPPTAEPVRDMTLTGEVQSVERLESLYDWGFSVLPGGMWYEAFKRRWPGVRFHSPGLPSSDPMGRVVIALRDGGRRVEMEAYQPFRVGQAVATGDMGRIVPLSQAQGCPFVGYVVQFAEVE